MTVGERIKEARKKCNLTQRQLGKKLGVSQQMIGQFENNKNPPKIETISKIANALNVPLFKLLGWEHAEDYIADRILTKKFELEDSGADTETIQTELDKIDILEELGLKNMLIEEDNRREKLLHSFYELNELGQCKAVEQIEMLTKIKEYTK